MYECEICGYLSKEEDICCGQFMIKLKIPAEGKRFKQFNDVPEQIEAR
ncbi:MAG: hypothetical protein WC796_04625 [Candidatus Pacearchaeota archaeon]|jgi:hypothetical protein